MIKVLIVDDSVVIRNVLSEILSSVNDITVVGGASDPYEAREMIKKLKPDVVTLDIEMPKMDGITFLKNLMRLHPLPVIMISTLTERGAAITLQALSLGAVDYVEKPDFSGGLINQADDIITKIRMAAGANVARSFVSDLALVASCDIARYSAKDCNLIAIGASTGGVEAIQYIINRMPENCPPIVVVQHIPPQFSTSYAHRLDKESLPHVHEASNNLEIKSGNVYIAPGDIHLTVGKNGSKLVCILNKSDKVSGHRPSVDVLFSSIAKLPQMKCIATLLTGMGEDGAHGLLELKNKGYHTIAQNKESSIVWGMPGSAVAMKAHCEELPLSRIPARLLQN